jgi:hypothetical protein
MERCLSDEPPSDKKEAKGFSKKERHGFSWSNIAVFWGRLFGNVFGHPKNLLDFKRQIVRGGPFSIF